MNFYALIYHAAEDFLSRRAPFRSEHLELARQAFRRGDLLLGGALGDPPDQALLIFQAQSGQVAEDFAARDPYVLQGLIRRWEVKPWNVVIGDDRVGAAKIPE